MSPERVAMEFLIIALATAFNLIVIKWKLEKKRYEDAILDGMTLLALASVFGGTMGGMIIATITSFVISLYLLISPPKFTTSVKTKDFIAEFKTKLPKS